MSTTARELLDETRKLLRIMREEHIERGSLTGRSQHAGEELIRKIDGAFSQPHLPPLTDEVQQLQARLSVAEGLSAVARSDWRPIDTRPRDGSPCLYWLPEKHLRSQVAAGYCAKLQHGGELFCVGGCFVFDLEAYPTHWMPIPGAPT